MAPATARLQISPVTPRELVRQAALENARWCELVCAAHGAPGELHASHWIDHHAVPRYYPRLVTLGGPEQASEHLGATRELVARDPGAAVAVKDSFRALQLEPLGLHLLFEATWIGLGAGAAAPDLAGARCTVVRDAEELGRWEDAWRGALEPAGSCAFPPALLDHPGLDFVACRRGDAIVATCVLHRSDGVVALSNLGGDPPLALRAGMETARERHPGLPLVGYESGAVLDLAIAEGFERLGPLAVWQTASRRDVAR